jgi:hypothetical protein
VVRRSPALLRSPGPGTLAVGLPLLALAYFIVAPELPGLRAGDETVLVAGSTGLLMIALATLALVPARETFFGPLLILIGAGLLTATLNAAGVGAAANVPEALVAGSIGLLFARALDTPSIAIAVPVFVGAIDVWSVLSGPTEQLLEANEGDVVDALSFDVPAWGHAGTVGSLGLSDAVFLAMFASWALRFGFRRGWTFAGLALGLVGSLVLGLVLDEAIPALPLIAAGFLAPNLDRIRPLFAAGAQE